MPEFGCRPAIKKAVNLVEHRLIKKQIKLQKFAYHAKNIFLCHKKDSSFKLKGYVAA